MSTDTTMEVTGTGTTEGTTPRAAALSPLDRLVACAAVDQAVQVNAPG